MKVGREGAKPSLNVFVLRAFDFDLQNVGTGRNDDIAVMLDGNIRVLGMRFDVDAKQVPVIKRRYKAFHGGRLVL